jgi:hypothetical protein
MATGEKGSVKWTISTTLQDRPEEYISSYLSAIETMRENLNLLLESEAQLLNKSLKDPEKDFRYRYVCLAKYILIVIALNDADLQNLDMKFLTEVANMPLELVATIPLTRKERLIRFAKRKQGILYAVAVLILAILLLNFFTY